MCDAHMSMPVSLQDADLSKPFVYDRQYGFFYVPFGYHTAAMGLLLAFTIGEVNYINAAEKMNVKFDRMADKWLEIEGHCFKSSVSNKVKAGKKGNLSFAELRVFGEVDYILD